MRSPIYIQAALHYHVDTTPFYEHDPGDPSSPSQGTGDMRHMATVELCYDKLIKAVGEGSRFHYEKTAGLDLYVARLMEVIVPEQVWA